ncbi:JNK-interacting protein 1 [Dendroctonus ponderosae]|uniref:JNK-interacting protein 1 n=1 Tax=Dendroctonus ponderosae TaxID=77166 RepID=A0AAR5PNF0_DENPD|nr:JNK-interacting protein 1 [Dendroctonus ponderosae]
MADIEFEQFGQKFGKNYICNTTNTSPFYSIVPVDEDSPSSNSPSPDIDVNDCDNIQETGSSLPRTSQVDKDDSQLSETFCRGTVSSSWKGERRRRKLPEIPKNKKSTMVTLYNTQSSISRDVSLAEELGSGVGSSGPSSMLVLKCGYLWDESPESDRLLTDADSGHSTAHSPTGTDGPKSMSPLMGSSLSMVGGMVYNDVDLLEATHRALHKFVPRHEDEIELEIGDPVYVQKEADDLWCEGVNLRTGRMGIFPSAYAVDSDFSDWDSNTEHGRRERYLLGYLGSVETLAHKGTTVVCQAVRRVIGNHSSEPEVQPCTLEVSDQGLRMVDRRKRDQNEPCIDYFYSLKNVSFCAFHPRDHRYLGFITKHPTLQRFACHVFRGPDSTRPVAEAVGRAFQRFYQKFIETAYPVEDIYIE